VNLAWSHVASWRQQLSTAWCCACALHARCSVPACLVTKPVLLCSRSIRLRGMLCCPLHALPLQDRIRNLQQLPDKRGILISAGKPHHVGNAAIILHVGLSPPMTWA